LAAFQGQEFFFDGQATAVAGEFSVAADNAMTGDDDGNRIGAVGQADCPRSVGIAEAAGELAVRDGFSVGDFAESFPDGELEYCARGREREIEIFQVSREVGAELTDGFLQAFRVFMPRGIGRCRATSVHKIDAAQAGVIGGEQERAEWAFDLGESRAVNGAGKHDAKI
jgi:hypothetical protein